MRLIDALKRTAQRCKDYVDSKHVELDSAIETNGMGWTDEDETVHQIDSKYIPSSGGTVVVTFNYTEDGLTASHTPAEVRELAKSNSLIGVLNEEFDGESVSILLGSYHVTIGSSVLAGFGMMGSREEVKEMRDPPNGVFCFTDIYPYIAMSLEPEEGEIDEWTIAET